MTFSSSGSSFASSLDSSSVEISQFEKLVHCFHQLPGIGEKTATRLAFFVLKSKSSYAKEFSVALDLLHQKTRFCEECQNWTDNSPCSLCQDRRRDSSLVLVVESSQDLSAIERAQGYRGLYHVLHGVLSPLNGVTPDDLKIKELLHRVHAKNIQEVILATNPNVEGEATSLYLHKILDPLGVRVSRLPSGIPVGSGIEFLDPLTLQRALEGRQLFDQAIY